MADIINFTFNSITFTPSFTMLCFWHGEKK